MYKTHYSLLLFQFSLVARSCPTLCYPMDCSMPGFPVHHQLPELAQTHVHRVGDATQPSHPLSSPSPLAFIFPNNRVFFNEPVLHIRWPKYWRFSFNISPSNEYSGLISFKIDWFDNQLSSVTQSCPTLCDPMKHSTPGLPVHHQLPEFTQTHIH